MSRFARECLSDHQFYHRRANPDEYESESDIEPTDLQQAFDDAADYDDYDDDANWTDIDENEEQGEGEDEAVEPAVPPCNCHEVIAQPLFVAPIDIDRCAICFEDIAMVNVTITRCGHVFHSSCAFEALGNNVDCPMCRTQLVNAPSFEEEEGEWLDTRSQDEEDNEDDAEAANLRIIEEYEALREPVFKVTVEQTVKKMMNMGFTPADFLRAFDYSGEEDDEFYENFQEHYYGVRTGKIPLSARDKRSYAQVACGK